METPARDAEQFGQGRVGGPAEDAQLTFGIDQAVDGDEGGDLIQRHAGAEASDQALQEAVEAEQSPGGQADVDVAEASRVGPGDGVGIDDEAADGSGGRRGRVSDFVHEAGQPGGIGQAFGDAEPVGRTQAVEASEVTDGALLDGAVGRAHGLHEGVVGVDLRPGAFGGCDAETWRPPSPDEATVGR